MKLLVICHLVMALNKVHNSFFLDVLYQHWHHFRPRVWLFHCKETCSVVIVCLTDHWLQPRENLPLDILLMIIKSLGVVMFAFYLCIGVLFIDFYLVAVGVNVDVALLLLYLLLLLLAVLVCFCAHIRVISTDIWSVVLLFSVNLDLLNDNQCYMQMSIR